MLSASASFPRRLVRRTREGIPGGAVWTSVLVFFLTLAIAKSTVTVAWVPATEVIVVVALSGAIFMGLLALAPIPWGIGIAIGMVAGPFVAGYAAWPAAHAANPGDPLSLGLLNVWWARILDGSAITMDPFDLFLIGWLMWVTGGWLAWCALRWRKPLLGMVPGAAAFATNLLNEPKDQNGYVLAVLVLTLALLLWSNYTGSIAEAARARVKLTGDARWDFWESGLVAMAALIVLAIMLPPISTVDRTLDMQSSAFSSWAQLLDTLNHPSSGAGAGAGGATTGFSADVLLNSSLKRNHSTVFTYTVTGPFVARPYFRGVNDTLLFAGSWRYQETNSLREQLASGSIPTFGETYDQVASAQFSIRMIAPPSTNPDVLFYPGQLHSVSRDAMALEEIVPPLTYPDPLMSIDRLDSVNPHTSRGTYNVTVEYSTATEADLRSTGTTYPDWLSAYTSLPNSTYRTPAVLMQIHSLAQQIVQDAGAQNVYDAASAIEAYFRSDRFTYSLTMQQPTGGQDRLAFFLFNTHKGYCEFFATAMGDMLRTLGIPTRLVSGFGPGQLDQTTHVDVVHSDDAHTWVEVYFPKYGWIPFEPTNDNVYFPIPRGAGTTNVCAQENLCNTQGFNSSSPTPGVGIRPGNEPNGGTNSGGNTAGFQLGIPDPGTITKIVGVFLAVLLVLLAALARYLRPRTVMGVWKRTLTLTKLAGVDERTGETPFETGRRLTLSFPEATEPIRSLASGFVVAAYAPPQEARSARTSVMEAWSALRPMLLRRALKRFRPI